MHETLQFSCINWKNDYQTIVAAIAVAVTSLCWTTFSGHKMARRWCEGDLFVRASLGNFETPTGTYHE